MLATVALSGTGAPPSAPDLRLASTATTAGAVLQPGGSVYSTGTVTRVSTTTAGGNIGGAVLVYRKTLSGAGAGDLLLVSTVGTGARATPFAVYRDADPALTGSTGPAYRLDTATGAVLALGNGQQTIWEHQVELDPTGRHAFSATASGQLAGDTNGHTDHYRRDLDGGVGGPLLLVTSDADGRATAGPIGSIDPAEHGRLTAITADEVVVTTSQALVSADTDRIRYIYVKDLVTGAVRVPLA